jgi:hypothetical protein
MHCGRPLQGKSGRLPATPDPDLCPLCGQKGIRVKTAFAESPHDLARQLAPPRKPIPVRIFGSERETAIRSCPRSGTWRVTAMLVVASATRSVYSMVVWTLAGVAVGLLLLATRQVATLQDLLSALQHTSSLRSVISAHVAATLPYFLAALASLAAALGLIAVRAAAAQVWLAPVKAYRQALKTWDAAYYCPADRIVFLRTATTVRWDPVEELQRLIARDG